MKPYLNLLRYVKNHGVKKNDRTRTGTLSVFAPSPMRFDLRDGFPLLTTKKIHFKSVAYELLWFLKKGTNIKYLNDHGVTIWDEWADENGDLGPVYGKQWRAWAASSQLETHFSPNGISGGGYIERYIDQLGDAIHLLKTDPDSRRIMVSAWNPADISKMALPPCHCFFQFYVAEGKLSCQMYQRSADVFLGVPFNIASYALLTMMVAQVCDLQLGEFIHTFGDAHIYLNHLEQVHEQLKREPRDIPTLLIKNRGQSIDDFVYEDFELKDYNPYPAIPAPIAK